MSLCDFKVMVANVMATVRDLERSMTSTCEQFNSQEKKIYGNVNIKMDTY